MKRNTHLPLDPACPGARAIAEQARAGYDDPMTEYYGAQDVIADAATQAEDVHRLRCQRCLQYGLANIEVI